MQGYMARLYRGFFQVSAQGAVRWTKYFPTHPSAQLDHLGARPLSVSNQLEKGHPHNTKPRSADLFPLESHPRMWPRAKLCPTLTEIIRCRTRNRLTPEAPVDSLVSVTCLLMVDGWLTVNQREAAPI